MTINHGVAMLVVLVGLASCGDDRVEPVARIDARDLRQAQARARAPGPVLEPMLVSSREAGVIYDAPPDLSLQPRDSLRTAPFGVTAAPDSAVRGARPDTSTRPRAAPQPPGSVRQP
jgi:hypothetical protein